jgi:hypothetical protein
MTRTLLAEVLHRLAAARVEAAVVGGLALAAHRVRPPTPEAEVLAADAAVLRGYFWRDGFPDATVEIRSGETGGRLLAGLVHVERPPERVDIMVGTADWQRAAVSRRLTLDVEGQTLPVVNRADLILLLLAGGNPRDRMDAERLRAADPEGVSREVEALLAAAPSDVRTAWETMARGPIA